jgi:hypothetical protein
LASESILADQSYSVGTIDFAALSPGHTTIAFPADEMKHIAVLDGTKAFTVRVDLSGMATRTMSLAGSHIRLAAAPNAPVYQAWFRDVPNITIVGPEEMLADLTPQNLWGEALVTEAILPGPNTLELRVRVTRDGASTDEDLPESHPDCWAYGTYTVRAALTEE